MFEKSGLCWTIIQKRDIIKKLHFSMNLLFCVYFYSFNRNCLIFLLNFLFIDENLNLKIKEPTGESSKRKLKTPIFSCQKQVLKFSFSENATKICAIVLMVLTLLSKCQNHKDDCANFLWPSQKS